MNHFIKSVKILFILAMVVSSCTQKTGDSEVIIEEESNPKEPISLFDGESLAGWHMDVPDLEADSSLRIPFIIRDGLLVSLGTPEGHLITDKEYKNYTLELDYRFAGEPGNCGILVHASEPRALYDMFPKSIEVQLMHSNAGDFWCIQQDIQVDDMESRRGPKADWGVSEGKERRVRNLTDDSEKPLGEWNHIKITCQDDKITVWLNGDLVNDGYGATAQEGQIALQAEGAEVEFKNIFLMENE
ncbi:3-keto-disaccharide hydrolase [Algoriphagus pacificus]|uniref:DUF1080 domain-containing protein n=1 Tax=Algoriphagus pacificus TaxID=2811234 RepID=A0ABS3CH51_9BACT|nr:DUF1080 domain-containing protein [Algoriphagus pacificus]MBN7815560.1 DUF1080 domain-containing protein [Algoriphagus pacificus]